MDTFYWILIGLSFLLAFAALVFPILPGALFLALGFVIYGLAFSFEPFSILFWIVQGILFASLFAADYAGNAYGVKRQGGSKAAIWGSTIGLIAGPFVIPIPFIGILIGPFLGAALAEMIIHKKGFKTSAKVGIGSLVGFIGSSLIKGIAQAMMIAYFLWTVL
ncbi:DUF456 domain-containing protein [Fictibacillus aquaticus]|uniref:DUF456 domain-containing protein n=1 Tax=Fictibacillus aquaticus TaxID=2021314 RepID=A0A235F9S8_9BACL|nr:DUF456 domain-containing protein [Fictibacillus aquaticus]OYD57919.1 hypothetical protein CGZ90_08470 [Fictibacillus aquaticus]